MAALRILYVMDPMSRTLVDKDTTFAFQLEGQRRGHTQYHCEPEDLFVDRTVPHGTVRRLTVQRADVHFHLHEGSTVPLAFFDIVFMRKDPPFDMRYFFATHLLALLDPAETLVVNSPRGLREANEKLYALNFPDLIPESLVTQDIPRLRGFLDTLCGEMIVKPLDGCGGAGVLHVRRDDRNLNALLEMSTRNGTEMVMAQRDLPSHDASAAQRRPLVRRSRHHRRPGDGGERHEPHRRPGDRPARRRLPRGAGSRLRRGTGVTPRPIARASLRDCRLGEPAPQAGADLPAPVPALSDRDHPAARARRLRLDSRLGVHRPPPPASRPDGRRKSEARAEGATSTKSRARRFWTVGRRSAVYAPERRSHSPVHHLRGIRIGAARRQRCASLRAASQSPGFPGTRRSRLWR